METTTLDELASELSARMDQLAPYQQHWIGLVGAPGSGKSTVAEALRQQLPETITVIPMDGYHFSKSHLDAMENSAEAYARRGAPFTFDAERLVHDLRSARAKGSGFFPSFDHTNGDPIADDIELKRGKRIVIVEGNYLLLNETPWSALRSAVFDDTWFLDVEPAECERRVENRHVETGMTREEAKHRVSTNDRPNAERVRKESMKNANRILQLASPTSSKRP